MGKDSKKSGKFFTTILIGGALGSVAAIVFGRRKKKKTFSEKIEDVLRTPKPEPEKKGFFKKFSGCCKKK